MEICLDAVGGDEPPNDTFISVRIGGAHKQTRFVSSRTHRFPATVCHEPYGRIEVFKRVGTAPLNFDNSAAEVHDVEVPCAYPGMSKLCFRASVKRSEQGMASFPDKLSRSKAREAAAQKYFAEHDLQVMLSDLVQEMINKKPNDPYKFLSQKLSRPGSAAALEPPESVPPALPIRRPSSGNLPRPTSGGKAPSGRGLKRSGSMPKTLRSIKSGDLSADGALVLQEASSKAALSRPHTPKSNLPPVPHERPTADKKAAMPSAPVISNKSKIQPTPRLPQQGITELKAPPSRLAASESFRDYYQKSFLPSSSLASVHAMFIEYPRQLQLVASTEKVQDKFKEAKRKAEDEAKLKAEADAKAAREAEEEAKRKAEEEVTSARRSHSVPPLDMYGQFNDYYREHVLLTSCLESIYSKFDPPYTSRPTTTRSRFSGMSESVGEAITQLSFIFDNLDYDKLTNHPLLADFQFQVKDVIAYSAGGVHPKCVALQFWKGSVMVNAQIHSDDADAAKVVRQCLEDNFEFVLQNMNKAVAQVPGIADVLVDKAAPGICSSRLKVGNLSWHDKFVSGDKEHRVFPGRKLSSVWSEGSKSEAAMRSRSQSLPLSARSRSVGSLSGVHPSLGSRPSTREGVYPSLDSRPSTASKRQDGLFEPLLEGSPPPSSLAESQDAPPMWWRSAEGSSTRPPIPPDH